MLSLENLHQLLVKLRELSVMFSPWWTRSSDIQQPANQPHRLLKSRGKSGSFRLSTSVPSNISELDSVKCSKRKSKHKRSRLKRHSTEEFGSLREITKTAKSRLTNGPLEDELLDQECSEKKNESCRIINLKIPLPDDPAFLLSRYYYHNPYTDYPRTKGDVSKTQEDGRAGKRTRRKGVIHRGSEKDKQPTLKSVELVTFATESQHVADVYSQHQRTVRPRSCSLTAHPPSSPASKYSSNLTPSDGSASSFAPPGHHSQPSLYQTNHLRTMSVDTPDLSLNSLHPSRHSILFRPILKYSHRSGTPGLQVSSPFPLAACNGIDGCRECLSNLQSVPQTLDGFKLPSSNFTCSRRGSLDSCSRLGVALPPLKSPLGQVDNPYGELHALGHSVTKYPPKVADRRNGKISLASTSMRSTREPPAPSYPDALTNGPPGYHRRLSQMAILVQETVRWEKEKPKIKSKKSSKASSHGSL